MAMLNVIWIVGKGWGRTIEDGVWNWSRLYDIDFKGKNGFMEDNITKKKVDILSSSYSL